MDKRIKEILDRVPAVKVQFQMEVEAACLEVTELAKDVSQAIGEISITEAKEAMVQEFHRRLFDTRAHAVFQGKK